MNSRQSVNETAAISSELESQFQHSERKLSVKQNLQELEVLVRSKEKEITSQEEQLVSLNKQTADSKLRLASFPTRYQESEHQLQRKLLSVMAERSELDTALCELESSGDDLVTELRNELFCLYREISDTGDAFRETKRSAELLAQKRSQQNMIIESMCRRVKKVQMDVIGAYGVNGPVLAALETVGHDHAIPVAAVNSVIVEYINPASSTLSDDEIQNCLTRVNPEKGLEDSIDMMEFVAMLDHFGIECISKEDFR